MLQAEQMTAPTSWRSQALQEEPRSRLQLPKAAWLPAGAARRNPEPPLLRSSWRRRCRPAGIQLKHSIWQRCRGRRHFCSVQQPHSSWQCKGKPHRGHQVARRQDSQQAGNSRNAAQSLQERLHPSQGWMAESAARLHKAVRHRVPQSAGIAWAGLPLQCSHSSLQQHQQ